MNCPNDNETLVMSERSGIEIDYCPKCRGVWLDRGELDKIIEANAPSNAKAYNSQADEVRRPSQDYRREDERYRDDKRYKQHHKRESFLGDLFDF